MLNVDRVWARQANKWGQGHKLTEYLLQGVTASFTLAANANSPNNPINFGGGALILGVTASATPTSQAGTLAATRPGLELFSLSISYQANNRVIVGPQEVIAEALFGQEGDQYPAFEIPLPQNTALQYSFTNLTSSEIKISITHHGLMPGWVS